MEDILPSEVARLVLGYLKEQECDEAYNSFLEKSPNLRECFEFSKRGRKFTTKLMGKSLIDILEEYCSIYCCIQEEIKKLNNASDEVFKTGSPVEQLKALVENLQVSGNQSGQTMFLRVTLPSNSNSSHGRVRTKSTKSNKKPVAHVTLNNSMNIVDISDEENVEAKSDLNTETTPLNSLPGHEDGEDTQKTPFRNKPKRKPVPNASTPHNSVDISQPDLFDSVDSFDFNIIKRTLLGNKELHETIAHNINKVINTPEVPPEVTTVATNPSQNLEKELNSVIKTVVQETENDPVFEKLIDDLIAPEGTSDESDHRSHSWSESSTPQRCNSLTRDRNGRRRLSIQNRSLPDFRRGIKKDLFKNKKKGDLEPKDNVDQAIIDDQNAAAIQSIIEVTTQNVDIPKSKNVTEPVTIEINPLDNPIETNLKLNENQENQPLVQPVSTPLDQPVSTPLVQPVSTSLVQPVSTPLVQPVSTPLVQPVSTPLNDAIVPFDTVMAEKPENTMNASIGSVINTISTPSTFINSNNPIIPSSTGGLFMVAPSPITTQSTFVVSQDPLQNTAELGGNFFLIRNSKIYNPIQPQFQLSIPAPIPSFNIQTAFTDSQDIMQMPIILCDTGTTRRPAIKNSQISPKNRKERKKIMPRLTTNVTSEVKNAKKKVIQCPQASISVNLSAINEAIMKPPTEELNIKPMESLPDLTVEKVMETIHDEPKTPNLNKPDSNHSRIISPSPKSGRSHIRSLDFATPIKDVKTDEKLLPEIQKPDVIKPPQKPDLKFPIATKSPAAKLSADWSKVQGIDLIFGCDDNQKEINFSKETKESEPSLDRKSKAQQWDANLRSLISGEEPKKELIISEQPVQTAGKRRVKKSENDSKKIVETKKKPTPKKGSKTEVKNPKVDKPGKVEKMTTRSSKKNVKVAVPAAQLEIPKLREKRKKILESVPKIIDERIIVEKNISPSKKPVDIVPGVINRNAPGRYLRKCNATNLLINPISPEKVSIQACSSITIIETNETIDLFNKNDILPKETAEFVLDKSKNHTEPFITPDLQNKLEVIPNPISANRNLLPYLETPSKDDFSGIPITPSFMSPISATDTPITKLLKEQTSIITETLPTPTFPITPGFGLTPKLVTESPASYSSRPTDYSSCSSYYFPSDTDQNKDLEQMLFSECSKYEKQMTEKNKPVVPVIAEATVEPIQKEEKSINYVLHKISLPEPNVESNRLKHLQIERNKTENLDALTVSTLEKSENINNISVSSTSSSSSSSSSSTSSSSTASEKTLVTTDNTVIHISPENSRYKLRRRTHPGFKLLEDVENLKMDLPTSPKIEKVVENPSPSDKTTFLNDLEEKRKRVAAKIKASSPRKKPIKRQPVKKTEDKDNLKKPKKPRTPNKSGTLAKKEAKTKPTLASLLKNRRKSNVKKSENETKIKEQNKKIDLAEPSKADSEPESERSLAIVNHLKERGIFLVPNKKQQQVEPNIDSKTPEPSDQIPSTSSEKFIPEPNENTSSSQGNSHFSSSNPTHYEEVVFDEKKKLHHATGNHQNLEKYEVEYVIHDENEKEETRIFSVSPFFSLIDIPEAVPVVKKRRVVLQKVSENEAAALPIFNVKELDPAQLKLKTEHKPKPSTETVNTDNTKKSGEISKSHAPKKTGETPKVDILKIKIPKISFSDKNRSSTSQDKKSSQSNDKRTKALNIKYETKKLDETLEDGEWPPNGEEDDLMTFAICGKSVSKPKISSSGDVTRKRKQVESSSGSIQIEKKIKQSNPQELLLKLDVDSFLTKVHGPDN